MKKGLPETLLVSLMIVVGVGMSSGTSAKSIDFIQENNFSLYDYIIDFNPDGWNQNIIKTVKNPEDSIPMGFLNFAPISPADVKYFEFQYITERSDSIAAYFQAGL